MIADADHNPPIRSFRTRNLAPHTTGHSLRRKESSIMADVCLLSRFVDMTFFELDLNTLVLISQAKLLYLHTSYTMGS